MQREPHTLRGALQVWRTGRPLRSLLFEDVHRDDDRLDLHVIFQGILAQVAAEAGLAVPSKGRRRGERVERVDPAGARPELARDLEGLANAKLDQRVAQKSPAKKP